MKSFQIKDLVISVGVDAERKIYTPTIHYTPTLCGNPSIFCHWPTICHWFTCGGCSVIFCSHLPSLIPTDITIWKTTTPVQTVVDTIPETELTEFKTQLAELQKYVDQKIQGAPEQLDQLEGKLKEAIEEVRAQKANLKKGK